MNWKLDVIMKLSKVKEPKMIILSCSHISYHELSYIRPYKTKLILGQLDQKLHSTNCAFFVTNSVYDLIFVSVCPFFMSVKSFLRLTGQIVSKQETYKRSVEGYGSWLRKIFHVQGSRVRFSVSTVNKEKWWHSSTECTKCNWLAVLTHTNSKEITLAVI